jgi:hypothetical protein
VVDDSPARPSTWLTNSGRERVRYGVTGHPQVAEDDLSCSTYRGDGVRHPTLISCTYAMDQQHIAVAAEDLAEPPATPSAASVAEADNFPDHAGTVPLARLGALATGLITWGASTLRRREARASGYDTHRHRRRRRLPADGVVPVKGTVVSGWVVALGTVVGTVASWSPST